MGRFDRYTFDELGDPIWESLELNYLTAGLPGCITLWDTLAAAGDSGIEGEEDRIIVALGLILFESVSGNINIHPNVDFDESLDGLDIFSKIATMWRAYDDPYDENCSGLFTASLTESGLEIRNSAMKALGDV